MGITSVTRHGAPTPTFAEAVTRHGASCGDCDWRVSATADARHVAFEAAKHALFHHHLVTETQTRQRIHDGRRA